MRTLIKGTAMSTERRLHSLATGKTLRDGNMDQLLAA
jgi:hypothetical protein